MEKYSLGTPASFAGIYYLKNERTGEVYVGQSTNLRRRYNEWKHAASVGYGCTNDVMVKAFERNPSLDEWVFVVVAPMPGASKEELLSAEKMHILAVHSKRPDLLINALDVPPTPTKAEPTPMPEFARNQISTARCRVVDENGNAISQAEAAARLGRNADNVKKKVRWFAERGVEEISIEDLKIDRRVAVAKYHEKQKGTATS